MVAGSFVLSQSLIARSIVGCLEGYLLRRYRTIIDLFIAGRSKSSAEIQLRGLYLLEVTIRLSLVCWMLRLTLTKRVVGLLTMHSPYREGPFQQDSCSSAMK